MLKGITKNGDLKNVIINEDGTISVKVQGEITQTLDKETTLKSNILILTTAEQIISINKKVTMIMVANYSETSDVSITVGTNTYQVGANLALELPMNTMVDNINIFATEDDTKIQLVVKGIE